MIYGSQSGDCGTSDSGVSVSLTGDRERDRGLCGSFKPGVS